MVGSSSLLNLCISSLLAAFASSLHHVSLSVTWKFCSIRYRSVVGVVRTSIVSASLVIGAERAKSDLEEQEYRNMTRADLSRCACSSPTQRTSAANHWMNGQQSIILNAGRVLDMCAPPHYVLSRLPAKLLNLLEVGKRV